MDGSKPVSQPRDRLSQELARAAAQERHQALEILAQQERRCDDLEQQLQAQLQALLVELADMEKGAALEQSHFEQEAAHLQAQLTQQATDFALAEEMLAAARAESTANSQRASELQAELLATTESLTGVEAKLSLVEIERNQLAQQLEQQKQAHAAALAEQTALLAKREASTFAEHESDLADREQLLAQQAQQFTTQLEDLTAQRQTLDEEKQAALRALHRAEEQERILDRQRIELAELQAETRLQRRRIAKEFQDRHQRMQAEVAAFEATQQATASAAAASSAQATAARSEETERLLEQVRIQGATLVNVEAQLENALKQNEILQFEHERLAQELAVGETKDRRYEQALANVMAERDQLASQLEQLNQASSQKDDNAVDLASLQRRLELATEDLRSHKRQNRELQDQITSLKSSGALAAPAASSGPLDWETQKRQLLAALEADEAADESASRQGERVDMEQVIRATDAALNEQTREIEELRNLLAAQSDNLGGVAVGAAAIAGMFNHDELIVQEREKLETLQSEWREKLRAAEIELSMERAKLARDRAELEEKLLTLQNDQARFQTPEPVPGSPEATRAARGGKWLTRLGLKEDPK